MNKHARAAENTAVSFVSPRARKMFSRGNTALAQLARAPNACIGDKCLQSAFRYWGAMTRIGHTVSGIARFRVAPIGNIDFLPFNHLFFKRNCSKQRASGAFSGWKAFLSALFFLVTAGTASAQAIPDKKEFDTYTSGGVDVMTGQFKLYSRDISVGSGTFPSRLDLVREVGQYPAQNDIGYATNNFVLTAVCAPCVSGFENRLTIKAFDGVHVYSSPYVAWGSARTWTNIALDGSQVIDNGGMLEYRSKKGDQIFFAATSSGSTGPGCGSYCRVPIYAVIVSGGSLVFSYENIPTPPLGNIPNSLFPFSRLKTVANSRGYGLRFGYMNPSTTTGDPAQMYLEASVTAFRTGCVAGVVSCSTGALASVSYGWTFVETNSIGQNLYRMTSFTNTQGRLLDYEYNGQNHRMTAAAYADTPNIKLFQNVYANWMPSPGVSSPYLEGVITQQTDANNQTTLYNITYRPDLPRGRPLTTITSPDGSVYTYYFTAAFDDSIMGLPTSITQPLSRTLTYTYDTGRLLSATDALGGKVTYVLDARGNVTQKTTTPKTGGTEAALTESAGFQACDATNFRYCNSPAY